MMSVGLAIVALSFGFSSTFTTLSALMLVADALVGVLFFYAAHKTQIVQQVQLIRKITSLSKMTNSEF